MYCHSFKLLSSKLTQQQVRGVVSRCASTKLINIVGGPFNLLSRMVFQNLPFRKISRFMVDPYCIFKFDILVWNTSANTCSW